MSDRAVGDTGDAPLDDDDQLLKDRSYSPASGRETEELQRDPADSPATDDVDPDAVQTLPGTGGPDDGGAVEAPPDTTIPRDTGAH
ncbi:hypothetical protein GCM10009840_02510 [Pseudolysinimonas kribbensis]|uniref:MatE family transporter n=1 Tax=Pseudolysinimonas kribbensis TaxID=433641 RepID=A0ABQ6K1R5_9MICO|nr:hypothetical protein [Pseudolysinimonas kribbensis]GMA94542.1 hypothetical protein GCM10025881_13660 [Pseudolysinimonas kribbensis]